MVSRAPTWQRTIVNADSMTTRLCWFSLLLIVGCGGGSDDATPTPPPLPVLPSRVDVTLSSGSVLVAGTSKGTARVFDPSGREVVGQSVT